MIGKANRTQTSRLFIHYTTRCPSATNYLFLLIQRCATMRKEPQSSPPVPSTSLAKADTCMLHVRASTATRLLCQPRGGSACRVVLLPSVHTTAWGDALHAPLPQTLQQTGLCTSAFQKQKVRGHTWWCCEGHHPIVGKSTSFKLHPLLPSLHFHLPLLSKRRESCN